MRYAVLVIGLVALGVGATLFTLARDAAHPASMLGVGSAALMVSLAAIMVTRWLP